MSDLKETCFSYTEEDELAFFSSSEKKWINKITKLAEQNPAQIEITHTPEDNHGMLCAKVPKKWLRISPPRQVNYTDEQRAAMAERLAAARDKKDNV